MENNESKMVTIHVMGKSHEVPGDLTIMKAMEYAGHQFRRGSGCRGGYCGACATIPGALPWDRGRRSMTGCSIVVSARRR